MNILVTAGNTQTPIDRVRCITNIFTGRTGTAIALHAHGQGHNVTLCTSHPEVVATLCVSQQQLNKRWRLTTYRTFDDLHALLQSLISDSPPDVIVHSAAVSDYESGGIFAPAEGTCFDAATQSWTGSPPALLDMSAGKVKSTAAELWLRLTRTPKLIDLFRSAWSYRGILVKFKLEVGLDDAALLEVAETSRRQSQADLMVANTLEGAASHAFLGPLEGRYQRVDRPDLPSRLLGAIESIAAERTNG